MKRKLLFAYVANLRLPSEYAIGIYVVKVCEAMAELGYQTHLLHPVKVQLQDFRHRNIWKYYGVKPNFFRHKPFQVLESVYKKPRLQFLFSHSRYFLVTWAFAIQALFYLMKNKIKLVETIDREMVLLLRLSFWYRPVVIYDAHIGPKTWYEFFLDWLMRPRVNLFMVNCQHFKQFYLSKGVRRSKIIVLPNGFDPKQFSNSLDKQAVRAQLKLPTRRFIIGYSGRFETFGVEKGVEEILKVATQIKRRIPVTVVAVGGPKELVKKYRRMAKELGLLSEEAIIRSQVIPGKVSQYLRSFDVVCMLYPNADHYRNKMSPLKMIEYMAAERPIIASNLPSITQVMNNKIAYFVRPGDQGGLKRTITSIGRNPARARKKAKMAYQFVQQFSWKKRQQRVLERLTYKPM